VPVLNPTRPMKMRNPFFHSSHLNGPSPDSQLVARSMMAGKKRASAVLLTAPTREMNRLR